MKYLKYLPLLEEKNMDNLNSFSAPVTSSHGSENQLRNWMDGVWMVEDLKMISRTCTLPRGILTRI